MRRITAVIFRHKYWFIFGFILLVGGLIFLKNFQESQARDKKEKPYKLKRQTLKEFTTISGQIEAQEKATLRFKTSGRLSWVGVKEGDHVRKFQTIASLDQRELKKNLQKDLNDYLKYRWDFDQTKEDYKDEIITSEIKRIIDKAQFSLNNAVIDVELQDIAVKYSKLTTPIEGIVTRVETPYGGINITPAQAEFEVVNPKSIYLSISADQTEVVNLRNGLEGKITLDSYPNKKINGVIKTISFTPKSNETGTVYEAKVIFNSDNDDYKYRIGMTGDFSFISKNRPNVLAIPLNYVKTEKGKEYVYQEKNKKLEKVNITLGEELDSFVEVKKGLKEGDVIY